VAGLSVGATTVCPAIYAIAIAAIGQVIPYHGFLPVPAASVLRGISLVRRRRGGSKGRITQRGRRSTNLQLSVLPPLFVTTNDFPQVHFIIRLDDFYRCPGSSSSLRCLRLSFPEILEVVADDQKAASETQE
jgi:hypothetical protein